MTSPKGSVGLKPETATQNLLMAGFRWFSPVEGFLSPLTMEDGVAVRQQGTQGVRVVVLTVVG